MRRLWARGSPATVRDVADNLLRERGLAYTTVMTVLDKLYKKGWLEREMVGRAYRYQPVISGAAYSAELMRQALDIGGDHAATFTHFLQILSPDEERAFLEAYRRLSGTPNADRSEPGGG